MNYELRIKDKNSQKNKGIVITYYGDGKGKTTAALGLALRAAGYKKKVAIIQFIKGNWPSGEESSIKGLGDVKIVKSGLGFVGIKNDTTTFSEHRKAAHRGLDLAEKEFANRNDVLILDEILGAVKGKLISEKNVLDLISQKPRELTLVLTGAPEISRIIENSDLVTCMKKIKHPYDQGQEAIKGIDY